MEEPASVRNSLFQILAASPKRHPVALFLIAALLAASAGAYRHLKIVREGNTIRLADDLTTEFHNARDAVVAHDSVAAKKFLDVSENDVHQLSEMDANNGHALYFSGEIKRLRAAMETPASFDADRCPVSQVPPDLTIYEADFLEYLEHWSELPADEKGPDDQMGNYASVCYDRASGYCWQRTRWIEHLLANDLYRKALQTNDKTSLDRASDYATDALKYRDATTNRAGFVQCTDTTTLLAQIRSGKENLHAASVK